MCRLAILALCVYRFAHAQTIGTVTTLAGGLGATTAGTADGVGTAASFNHPSYVAADVAGSVAVVVDSTNHLIRKIILSSRVVSTLAGTAGLTGIADGSGTSASFNAPYGVAMDAAGTFVIVSDQHNHVLRRIPLATGVVSTIAGSFGTTGVADGVGSSARFNFPTGIAMTAAGDMVLVADWTNYAIRKFVVATATVTTLAGVAGTTGRADGVGTGATFQKPVDVTMDALGTVAIVADTWNNLIRRITISSGVVVTLAGKGGLTGTADGVGTAASFDLPFGASLDSAGSFALITDQPSCLIRYVNVSSGAVSTIAGTALTTGRVDGVGTATRFWSPQHSPLTAWGTTALVADASSNTIRSIVIALPSSSQSQSLTQSSSRTQSPTATASQTLTLSQASTVTQTQTVTLTTSPSPTTSASQMPTQTPSVTVTPTQTSSQFQSSTGTVSPSLTQTTSETTSPSQTLSQSATPTLTSTPTATMTSSQATTRSSSSTVTVTPTASQRLSPTPTATPSSTLSQAATATQSPSTVLTATPTESSTASQTPSAGATPSSTASASGSAASTITQTASSSQALTPSQRGSPSTTETVSQAATSTPSGSPSLSQGATPTPSSSPSSTQAATPTASPTATGTPSESPTQSSTQASTATQTLSLGASPTSTRTPTQVSTPSQSASTSQPPTQTQTQSPTLSTTLTSTGSAAVPSLSASLSATGSLTQARTSTVSASPSQSRAAASPSPSTAVPSSAPATSATPAAATASVSASGTLVQSSLASPPPSFSGGASSAASPSATPSPSCVLLNVPVSLVLTGGVLPEAVVVPAVGVLARLGLSCFLGVPLASVSMTAVANGSVAIVVGVAATVNTQTGDCGQVATLVRVLRNRPDHAAAAAGSTVAGTRRRLGGSATNASTTISLVVSVVSCAASTGGAPAVPSALSAQLSALAATPASGNASSAQAVPPPGLLGSFLTAAADASGLPPATVSASASVGSPAVVASPAGPLPGGSSSGSSGSTSLPAAAVAGLAVGIIALVLAVAVASWLLLRGRRPRKSPATAAPPLSDPALGTGSDGWRHGDGTVAGMNPMHAALGSGAGGS